MRDLQATEPSLSRLGIATDCHRSVKFQVTVK